MRPTPNQIIGGVRDLLRQDIGPEVQSERAIRNLRKIMAVLRDVDWNEAGFRIAHENVTLKALAQEVIVWIGATREREESYGVAATPLRSVIGAPASDQSFAQAHEFNLAVRAALARFIEVAAHQQPANVERDATAQIRGRIAATLAALPD